jgi:hypothetical protein
MAELPPALAAALRGDRPLLFGCVEINLPGYDVLLLDGAAQLMIGSRKFVGRDQTYGVLDTLKGLGDGLGDKAPSVTMGLKVPLSTSLAALLDPAVQGSAVTISFGAIDPWTGLAVSLPKTLLSGELDVPTVTWDANTRDLEYKITTDADRLFATEEGNRLSDSWHQGVWPGELGLAFVTDVETTVPWGQKLDTSAIETRTNIAAIGAITYART